MKRSSSLKRELNYGKNGFVQQTHQSHVGVLSFGLGLPFARIETA
jgi:hypothetical protein